MTTAAGDGPEATPVALDVAREVTDYLVGLGARAVWLAGSLARGDAGPHSDIDLGAVVDEPQTPSPTPTPTSRRRGVLVNVSWVTVEATRASFRNPAVLGAAIPGWRNAVLMYDPDGIAAAFRDEARAWHWADVAEECDRWVAEEGASYAEEVQKLANALHRRSLFAAGVQRSLLALRMAVIMSVQRRILYDSENVLWDLVAEAMGEPWASTQRSALGTGGEPFEVTCGAACASTRSPQPRPHRCSMSASARSWSMRLCWQPKLPARQEARH